MKKSYKTGLLIVFVIIIGVITATQSDFLQGRMMKIRGLPAYDETRGLPSTCNDGIWNGEEQGVDCGRTCEKNCCENGYLDETLGECDIDLGGSCGGSCVWEQTNGPLTDYNPRIFFDPDDYKIIYTSSNTGNGILKSTDRGNSWQKLDTGISIPYVFYFDIAPSDHEIMYASTAIGSIYKSNDKGVTWDNVTNNLDTKGMGIWTLEIHPENPNIVYVGTGAYIHPVGLVEDGAGVIFKTSNGGETWEQMDIGNKGRFISSIRIDPVNPNTVYATTAVLDACKANSMDELAGVFKTTNGGETWEEANNGLLHHGVHALVIDPTDHNTLFVGTGCVGLPDLPEGNIFKSTNAGETWTQIIDSPNHSIGPVVFDPKNPDIMYAAGYFSFYRSQDHGNTWEAIYPMGEGGHYEGASYAFPFQIAIHPYNSDIIFMGTYSGGIIKSTNGGKDWIPSNGDKSKGFVIGHANAVSVFPSDPNIMYAATIGGPFKTTNGGDTWQPLKEEQHDYSVNRGVKVDPVDPNIVYFGGLNSFVRADGDNLELFLDGSSNNPDQQSGSELSPQFIDLLFKRSNHNIVYTAFLTETDLAPQYDGFYRFDFSDPNNPLYEKRNNGLTNKRIHALAQDKKTNTIYAGTESWTTLTRSGGQGKSRANISDGPGSLFKTTNEGQSWNKVSNDLSFITAYKLLVPENNNNHIYAATNGHGVYFSGNKGQNWEPLGAHDTVQYTTLIDFNEEENTVYTYDRSDQKVYKTIDWDEPGQEYAPQWIDIFDLSIINTSDHIISLKTKGDYVYLGTEKNGLYISDDNGESWSNKKIILSRLPSKKISWIEIDPFNPSKIYAALVGEKALVYVSNDHGQTWSKLNDPATFSTIHELTVDPNNEAVVYSAPWGGGLFVSSNNGQAWQKIETPTISISSIIVDPQDSNHLIIGDRTKPKIYESYNKGQTWSELVSLDEDDYYRVTSMALHQGKLYFSVFNKVNGFISILINGPVSGTTFKLENNNPVELGGDADRSVLNFFSDGNDLYAVTHIDGVFRLENNDLEKISDALPDMAFNNVIKDENGILYVSGGGDIDLDGSFRIGDNDIVNNIYYSPDEGESWNPLLEGDVFGSTIKRFFQHPINKDMFFAATANGLFVSTDNGNSWSEQNNGLHFENISSMFVANDYVYVGTSGGGTYAGEIKQDHSIDWTDSTGPFPEIYNIQIKADPENQGVIYLTSFPGGVFKSTDAGNNWVESNFALPSFSVADPTKLGYYNLIIDPFDSNELYLGIFGKGVYKSTNGAQTWMPLYELDEKSVYTVASTGDHLVVGTNSQPSIYKTPIDDQDWDEVALNDGRTVVSSIAVGDNSDVIYAAAFPGGLFKTEDGGDSWKEISTLLDFRKKFVSGIGFENFFFNVLVNPNNSSEIYLSGYLGELYRSKNGGETWSDFSKGLVRQGIITDLDIDNNGDVLVVSQKAGGVSKMNLK